MKSVIVYGIDDIIIIILIAIMFIAMVIGILIDYIKTHWNKIYIIKFGIAVISIILAMTASYFVAITSNGDVPKQHAVVHINDTTIKGEVEYYEILSTGLVKINIGGVEYTTNIENVSLIENEEE